MPIELSKFAQSQESVVSLSKTKRSFFQGNEVLTPDIHFFDSYCGTGTWGLESEGAKTWDSGTLGLSRAKTGTWDVETRGRLTVK